MFPIKIVSVYNDINLHNGRRMTYNHLMKGLANGEEEIILILQKVEKLSRIIRHGMMTILLWLFQSNND